MNTSSPTFLQLFYQAIHSWIVAGLPEDPVRNPYGFIADTGLCSNLVCFCTSQNTDSSETFQFMDQMKDQFCTEDLNRSWPFGSVVRYAHECRTKTIFQNQQRLDWIKNHV